MKRLLLFFVCLVSVFYAHATDSTALNGTQEDILKELIQIRTLQDSTYKQRMRAFEERNKKTSKDSPSEYSMLNKIKGNTEFDFWKDGCNLLAILAFIASLIAVIYAKKQWESQRETENNTKKSEQHTKNVPISIQKGKLADLPRHFYRNIVCSCAIIFKYYDKENEESGNRKGYPSESNLLKLQTLPDDIFLPIDIDENSYEKMHELRLLFRNYNMEVLVASNHLAKRHLTDNSLKEDFDNLLFKPLYLTRKAFVYESLLSSDLKDQNRSAVEKIINEHFVKLKTNISILMRSKNNEYLKQMLSADFNYIKEFIDKKGALRRSMGAFAKINIDNNNEFIQICKDETQEKTEALQKFIIAVTSGATSFISWFNENYEVTDKEAKLGVDKLCESLKPYFDYLSCASWDFETLFYYMLAIDVAIETDRIGMINY